MNGLQTDILDDLQTPLFDTYSAATSASVPNSISFFNSRTKGGNGLQVTNMELAGMLPSPERFKVYGLSFTPIGCDEADIMSLMKNYVARLIVGGKTYLEGPLELFPSVGGIVGAATTTATTTTIKNWTNGLASFPNTYAIAPDLAIPINANDVFRVELVGTTGFTAASAGNGLFLRAYLLGIWSKQVR